VEPRANPQASGSRAPFGDDDARDTTVPPSTNGQLTLSQLLHQTASNRRRHSLQRGTILYSEDDRADGAYLLVSGQVKLTRLTPSGKEVLLELVEPGQVFGLRDVISGPRRSATATALAESHVVRITRVELDEALRRSPRLMRDILRTMARRMTGMERRMEALMTQTVPKRLGRALLDLSRSNDGGDAPRAVGLTHQELGNLVGTSRETVSLFLARFRRQGWVATERGRIRILDPGGLEEWLESGVDPDEIASEGAPDA